MNRTRCRRILCAFLLLVSLAPAVAFAGEAAERAADRGIFEPLLAWLPELWDGFVVLLDDSGGSLDPWGGGTAVAPPDPNQG
jgi:hypothetical protein